MSRISRTAIASLAALALAAPVAADAAKPSAGSWLNKSSKNGAAFTTRGNSIRNLSFFCNGWSYDLKQDVAVRRDGTFSYRGVANLWGHEHQWLGNFRVRLSGKFASPRRAVISRSLRRCGHDTVTVRR